MQFILTKNKQLAVAYIILERITESFEKVEITPKVFKDRLHIEYGIYDDKQQNKLKIKYSKIFEHQYQKFIPNGHKIITIKIKLLENGVYLNCKTELEAKEMIIQLENNEYLKLTKL